MLLPALVSPSTCVELLHSLLDLPLLVSALEKLDMKGNAVHLIVLIKLGGDMNAEDSADSNESQYRVIYNHLLRNESGASINFWAQPATLVLLQQFCKVSLPLLSLR